MKYVQLITNVPPEQHLKISASGESIPAKICFGHYILEIKNVLMNNDAGF